MPVGDPRSRTGSGSPLARLCALLTVLLLAGCAGLPKMDAQRLAALPSVRELTATPFFPQEAHHCGPAALATVLTAAGFDTTPDKLAPMVYLPARQGSLPLDMLGGARRTGAFAVRLEPGLEALFEQVAAGTPVVILQNLGLSWYPMWHYAVVVGFDLTADEVILRSGREARQLLPLATFSKTWDRSGRWAMVAVRPGEVPASATHDSYAEGAIALERLGRLDDAHRAYVAGLSRWPGDLTLAIGAGNTAYAKGDLAAAESAFRTAARANPESDAALNNLAHVLAERGDLAAALATAEAAVALDGPNRSVAEKTLAEIRARRKPPATR
ncbi:MAG: PA2778 family cysteine peptidase [Betaproteobacteria bacterium]|nr:PA2778 family cysteine peptidase [Betaproteobacteria bacterium]